MPASPASTTPGAPPPRLSICIPTFNRANLLQETLTHLLELGDDDLEVAVSDNCSPDGTQDVIGAFAGRFRHFRAVRQRENCGAMRNFAAALSLARGRFLYPLSDDDRIHIQALRNAISIMEENPNIAAVFGGYEEWLPTSGVIEPYRLIEGRIDFARGDKLTIFTKFPLLWHPVCRTEVFHRYVMPDRKSFGFWELVGSLLERGDVSVTGDIFYRHAQTEPRLEYELTENWYHDAYRAGFECFVGRIGPFNPDELAKFVAARVTEAYLQGVRFATVKRNHLAARHFLLRARAYGLIAEPAVMAWERGAMIGLVAERLLAKIELMPEIDEILFEATGRFRLLREQCAGMTTRYSFSEVSEQDVLRRGVQPNQVLVTNRYGSFESGAPTNVEPTRAMSAEDLIETCRVTDQRFEFAIETPAAAAP